MHDMRVIFFEKYVRAYLSYANFILQLTHSNRIMVLFAYFVTV